MSKQKMFCVILVLALVFGGVFGFFQYFAMKDELARARVELADVRFNEKILGFGRMFVRRVLMADGEIDFETRLKLENSVRELESPKIFTQWQAFTASQTEEEAQTAVKHLLNLLFNEISIR